MRGNERIVFCIVAIRATNEIFEKKQVSRASLHNCQEPVSKLEFPAPRIGFLSRHKGCKVRVLDQEVIIGRESVCEGRYERGVERQIGEMR